MFCSGCELPGDLCPDGGGEVDGQQGGDCSSQGEGVFHAFFSALGVGFPYPEVHVRDCGHPDDGVGDDSGGLVGASFFYQGGDGCGDDACRDVGGDQGEGNPAFPGEQLGDEGEYEADDAEQDDVVGCHLV